MSSEGILGQVSNRFGLNLDADAMLSIACAYIDAQGDSMAFEEFVERIGRNEDQYLAHEGEREMWAERRNEEILYKAFDQTDTPEDIRERELWDLEGWA